MTRTLVTVTALFALSFALSACLLAFSSAKPQGPQQVPQIAQAATSTTAATIVLYVGDGCPHCALVEKYLSDNNVAAKIPYTQKEVFNDSNNAKELVLRAQTCGISSDSIGVPLLWDGATCHVGDQPVIDFFKAKLAQQ